MKSGPRGTSLFWFSVGLFGHENVASSSHIASNYHIIWHPKHGWLTTQASSQTGWQAEWQAAWQSGLPAGWEAWQTGLEAACQLWQARVSKLAGKMAARLPQTARLAAATSAKEGDELFFEKCDAWLTHCAGATSKFF